MKTRRQMLGCVAGLPFASLVGCTELRRVPEIDSAVGAIDMHAHIFNGLDIPRVGFLEQVILRDPHSDSDPNQLTGGFLKLLAYILLTNTPTAKEELRGLRDQRPSADALRRDPVLMDEQNVAEAIARFTADQSRQPSNPTGLSRANDRAVIDLLYRETGAKRATTGFALPQSEAKTLAANIYEQSASDTALSRSRTRDYKLNKSTILQTIRWAGLLTRSREAIYDELVGLYGGPNGISVYSPSIVDFQLWFQTEEKVTPIRDQISVMSALARRRQDAILLNFAPFCPLRAALLVQDNPGADPLADIKWAITQKGFVGVKLYPPLGFRPLGNKNARFNFVKRVPKGVGKALDKQLLKLYAWCEANDVPIKAHANNSIEAGICTGLNASPTNWIPVLDKFPNLRLNLAHFGGFDETSNTPEPLGLSNRCVEPTGRDWEDLLTDMLGTYRGLYFDLGYWIETSNGGSDRRKVLRKMRALIEREPLVVQRMMFASDWSMIGRETSHRIYRVTVLAALKELNLSSAQRGEIEGGNAHRYLGIDQKGKQYRRLDAFFKNHPVWRAEFQKV